MYDIINVIYYVSLKIASQVLKKYTPDIMFMFLRKYIHVDII